MNVWLDDERAPHMYGHLGWTWVKSYEEVIAILQTGKVEKISLDHDLLPQHYQIPGRVPTWANDEHTGYHVALWMEENGTWPAEVTIHSMSEAGRARIAEVCRRCGIRCRIEMARISR